MKIHHIRNATMVIESGAHYTLVDPMLGDRRTLPAFARWRHQPRRNPMVPLPANANAVLDQVTHCLITHSQKWGLKALQHTDHLDEAGASFLQRKQIPVVTRFQDTAYLHKMGLRVARGIHYWEPAPFLGGKLVAVPARHGHGWIHNLMANGAGFFLDLPGEPSIYIAGDTVFTKEVQRALTELCPDVAVMAAGSASLDVGGPILMPLEELMTFVSVAPKRVIANHLEALNHCPTTRSQLRSELDRRELSAKVTIPQDGETIAFEGNH